MARLLRLLVAVVALSLPLGALAQGCPALADLKRTVGLLGYDGALAAIKDRNCLGDSKSDPSSLVQEIDRADAAAEEPLAAAGAALRMLSAYSATRGAGKERPEDWQAMSRALSASAARLAQAPPEQAIPLAWERIEPRTQGELVFDGRPVKLLAPTGCERSAAACPAFEQQRDMIRVVNLAARQRDVAQRPSLKLHLDDARLQLERWESYRAKGQHQYFWEVWLNGERMGRDLCPADPASGIQRGFCAVPRSQWIVLHPDAGLRWVRSATRSSELKPAFIVELLGYYRWDWRSASSAELSNRFGASLTAAYTDVSTGRKWSYGPMLHFGSGYNIAFTKASGEKWGILVSLNLAERYFGRRQEYVDYLKSLEKPGAGRLLD